MMGCPCIDETFERFYKKRLLENEEDLSSIYNRYSKLFVELGRLQNLYKLYL